MSAARTKMAAAAAGIFRSVDANRGDYRLGWDTDEFPRVR